MSYATLKLIHVSAVALSFSGFAARGVGVLSGASWVRHHLTRTVPHVIDTVLLASALGMLWVAHLAPWAVPWLRAKIPGLILYIALGALALRPARAAARITPTMVHQFAWIAAFAVFGYIMSVAIAKDPRGALIWLK